MIRGFRFQKVSLRISKSGQRVYFNTESHKDFTQLKGIALTVGHEGALYGSTFGFRIDEKEVLDESHEAHLLVFGNDVAPNRKMLLFEIPIPINSSKIEGIYTDSSLQDLLGNASYNPGGGIISKNDVNVKKTYVSGKEVVKYSNFQVDGFQMLSGSGFSIGGYSVTPAPVTVVYYPYDVKVTLLLTR
ncbi:hypothetical protein [Taibaiella soli]|jgi:hypothetical protein|uniref:Uncharacterized protein n=1 Tax=Taibaiella soli TaxID=1649169 RepID=A0A2W2B6E5_9BACT|nr:hypothetical protein [Taibaiella soli]PZF71557.1 hypothetical protein DN068_15900 [Taibaiella soli]